jgi:hypothetical protein
MTTAQHRASARAVGASGLEARRGSAPSVRSRTALVATIERRLLVNYRVDPAALTRLLPDGLRPQLVDGSAVAGVCLLRMGGLRPGWVPRSLGWGGENAAHRIAVEWDGPAGVEHGVYIPIRHSASWVPVALGGRLMPGVHRHARFDVEEHDDRFRVSLAAPDVEVDVDVSLDVPFRWRSSLFGSVDAASEFFRGGSVGWSPGHDGRPEGLELRTDAWAVRPGHMHRVRSTFFDALPRDSAEFDDVLVMQRVPITWGMPRFADRVRLP